MYVGSINQDFLDCIQHLTCGRRIESIDGMLILSFLAGLDACIPCIVYCNNEGKNSNSG